MDPIGWIRLFAEFAQVLPEVVDNFVDAHPELGDPPKPDAQHEIDKAFDAAVRARFGAQSDKPEE